MTVEATNTINGLDSGRPGIDDDIFEGDDHIRMLKRVLKSVFPGANGNGFATPIVATEAELNRLSGVTSPVQTQINTANTNIALKANIASPTFTGAPRAPTQLSGDNSTLLATTAFVAALGALKANLASPAFTGTPTVPTPTITDNSTKAINSAFVKTGIGASLAANGYIHLPSFIMNGFSLIIQWGHLSGLGASGSGSFSFPIPFTAACLGVCFSDQVGSGGGKGSATAWTSVSTSSVTYSKATGTTEFYYLAIGY